MKFCFTTKDFIESNIQPQKRAVIGVDYELSWEEFSAKVDALCAFFIQKGLDNTDAPVLVY